MRELFVLLLICCEYSWCQRECGSMKIEEYKELDQLENCTAILGNLVLIFPNLDVNDTDEKIIGYNAIEINNRSFPLLTEITGYLGVISVTHLNSLEKMFTNLRVIRGRRLMLNFALFMYETNLIEITLRNLQKIQQGSVGIGGNNMRLCLPSIDWNKIIVNGRLQVWGNSSKNCTHMKFEMCHTCEIVTNTSFCWRNEACQRFEETYSSKNKLKIECHKLCLGGCKPNSNAESADDCYACKDLSENGKCVEKCSDNYYLNVDTRRCVTREKCQELKRFSFSDGATRKCLRRCPTGFRNSTFSCEKCTEPCPRNCIIDFSIKSIQDLQSIGIGCSIITGDLHITSISNIKNFQNYLNLYFGDVEEIHGALIINSSHSIVNLAFLNNLHVVKGAEDQHHNISIEIVGNNNLTSLNWKNPRTITIGRGEVLINLNRNLCASEIHNFMKTLSGNYSSSYIEVKHWKNCLNPIQCIGKRIIGINHTVISHDSVMIKWRNASLLTGVQLDSYQIKYVAYTKHQIVTEDIFGEEPNCGSLRMHEITLRKEELISDGKMLRFILSGLNQYTRYAYIVQTNLEGNVTDGLHKDEVAAVTTVQRFRTFLNVPSRVVNVTTISKSASAIVIAWDVINEELNEIEEFIIDVIEKPHVKFDEINYCNDYDTLNYKNLSKKEYFEDDTECIVDDSCCTVCCKHRQDYKQSSENFEKSLADLSGSNLPKKSNKLPPPPRSARRISTKNLQTVKITTGADGKPLKALTRYLFHIRACAKTNSESICSDYVNYLETTSPNSTSEYDKVVPNSPKVVREDEKYFQIKFNEPELVNGVILYYVIHFFKLMRPYYNDSIAHLQFCVNRIEHEQNNFTFTIENFRAGDHLYLIRAVSLKGRGPKIDYEYFKVLPINGSMDDEFTSEESNAGEEFFFVMIVLLPIFTCTIGICYYYRHRIRIMWNRRHQDDESFLLHEVEETDFGQIAERHQSSGTMMYQPNVMRYSNLLANERKSKPNVYTMF